MRVDLLIHNIGQLVTLVGPAGPRRGRQCASSASSSVARWRPAEVASSRSALRMRFGASVQPDAAARRGRAGGHPGLCRPAHAPALGRAPGARVRAAHRRRHLHGDHGRGRRHRPHRDRHPGGVASTAWSRRRTSGLGRMLRHGTTTAEAKTGYGLNVADELKQLEAIAALQAARAARPGPDVPRRARGARGVPRPRRTRTWIWWSRRCCPRRGRSGRSCERCFPKAGPSSATSSARTARSTWRSRGASLRQRERLGFGLKMHVDEFAPLGGTPLAVELGAISVDHIVTTPPEHVALLARSNTIGVALPGTPFGLAHHDYSPGRALIDQGGALALATDLNPGTSWCENMQMMLALACRYMRLLPAEALVAATLNARMRSAWATWSAASKWASRPTCWCWTRTTTGCCPTGTGRTWSARGDQAGARFLHAS